MGVKLDSSKSDIGSGRVTICALFVLLLALVSMGGVHGEPYEDVLKEVRIMQSRISNLEQLVLSQQKRIKRLRGEQEETALAQTRSTRGRAIHGY